MFSVLCFRVVWFCVVRCYKVLCAVLSFDGVVWCSVVVVLWCSVVLVEWGAFIWCDLVRCSVLRCGVVWIGGMGCGVVLFGVVGCYMA